MFSNAMVEVFFFDPGPEKTLTGV